MRYADPRLDGVREPVTGRGQVALAGIAGQGKTAFMDDWHYVDANGNRVSGSEDSI